MSSSSVLVTRRHFEYLKNRTVQEDDFLADLKKEAAKEEIPPIWISPEQASFMQILLRLQNAKDVVEVGTLAGYSAIVMARALPDDGHVHTLELMDKHADFAEKWVAKSDVAGKVTVHRGDARESLKKFEADSTDAMFLDADKSGYPAYLNEGMRMLRARGLMMVDNAFAFGQLFDENPTDREVPAVREFNETMAKTAGLQSIIMPIGDGLWVGVKC